MYRIAPFLCLLVVFIAGCGDSDRPSSTTSKTDTIEQSKPVKGIQLSYYKYGSLRCSHDNASSPEAGCSPEANTPDQTVLIECPGRGEARCYEDILQQLPQLYAHRDAEQCQPEIMPTAETIVASGVKDGKKLSYIIDRSTYCGRAWKIASQVFR